MQLATELLGALEEIGEFLTALISPHITHEKIVCAAMEHKIARNITSMHFNPYKILSKSLKIIFQRSLWV